MSSVRLYEQYSADAVLLYLISSELILHCSSTPSFSPLVPWRCCPLLQLPEPEDTGGNTIWSGPAMFPKSTPPPWCFTSPRAVNFLLSISWHVRENFTDSTYAHTDLQDNINSAFSPKINQGCTNITGNRANADDAFTLAQSHVDYIHHFLILWSVHYDTKGLVTGLLFGSDDWSMCKDQQPVVPYSLMSHSEVTYLPFRATAAGPHCCFPTASRSLCRCISSAGPRRSCRGTAPLSLCRCSWRHWAPSAPDPLRGPEKREHMVWAISEGSQK